MRVNASQNRGAFIQLPRPTRRHMETLIVCFLNVLDFRRIRAAARATYTFEVTMMLADPVRINVNPVTFAPTGTNTWGGVQRARCTRWMGDSDAGGQTVTSVLDCPASRRIGQATVRNLTPRGIHTTQV